MANIVSETKTHYTLGSEARPTIISKVVYDGVKSNTLYPMMAPDASYIHPPFAGRVEFSRSNSKVEELAAKLGLTQCSYGKSTVQSCAFAGSCVRFCYQNVIKYPASLRLHAHNYYMTYAKTQAEILEVLDLGYKSASQPDIIRLNDNGDFTSKNEILAFVDMANKYPQTVFYGYTKNTPHLYKARQQYGMKFPSNLRISISDLNDNDKTSEKYQNIIRNEFPNEFMICRIIDTIERDEMYADLPWNDGEIQAYNYTNDFKIAIHVGASQRQYCTSEELIINDKYSDGQDDDGIAYC
jgi:hypothetical protein